MLLYIGVVIHVLVEAIAIAIIVIATSICGHVHMVAVMEQKIPHLEDHDRFIPLMHDSIYNCELCGVRIAVLQIETSSNDQLRRSWHR